MRGPVGGGGGGPGGGRRGGFALAMVVLLLLAVAVAGAAAYQLVRVEAELSIGVKEANDALSVAHAGLERYLAQSLGPPDTAAYLVGDGSVTVTPRKVATLNDSTDLYLVRAEGTVSDPRYPGSPARRIVQEYARLHRRPVKADAALLAAYGVAVNSGAHVTGVDTASASCPDQPNIIGVAASGGISGGFRISGSPATVSLASAAAVLDSAGVNWGVLQDAQQPVGVWDGVWPGSLPSDSFPVIRVTGDFSGSFFNSGQGVLIVPGQFSIGFVGGFDWDGIILAGSLGSIGNSFSFGGTSTIDGLLVGGLDGGGGGTIQVYNTDIRYRPCRVRSANANLAYLEPLDATWWEGL